MSVRSNFEMCCPECGDDSQIIVTFIGTCRLMPDGTEDYGDHEWQDTSPARCEACNFDGTVADFALKPVRESSWRKEFNEAYSEWQVFHVDDPTLQQAFDSASEADAFIAEQTGLENKCK